MVKTGRRGPRPPADLSGAVRGAGNVARIVYLGAAPNQQILPAVDWAVNTLHKKRFFLVGSDYVFPRAANAIIKDHLKQLGGEVVGEEYIPLGSSNTDAAVAAIVKAKPDMILNTINGDSNITFFRDLRAAGVKPADDADALVQRQRARACAASARPTWPAITPRDTYFQSIDTPENRDFVRRFHDKYPQRAVTDPMETAYVGVKLWAMAVNEAQSLEPKKIRRALLGQRIRRPRRRSPHRFRHAARLPHAADRPDSAGRPIQGHLDRGRAGEAGAVSDQPHGRGLAGVPARPVHRLGQPVGRAPVRYSRAMNPLKWRWLGVPYRAATGASAVPRAGRSPEGRRTDRPVAVLDDRESDRFFGVPLARRGIQPVWLQVQNIGKQAISTPPR